MKLEDQVTNLKLSKKLKELGVGQDSLYYWIKMSKDIKYYGSGKWELWSEEWADYEIPVTFDDRKTEKCSAFLISELIDLMSRNNRALRFTIGNYTGGSWYIPPVANYPHFRGNTQADVFAKMLIFLIEKGDIKCLQK